MEYLSMCRICLATDVRMCFIASHLRDMYERITSLTFKREDRRPLVACYICHARLQNCYRLRTSCLRSEELLTEMMSSNVSIRQDLTSSNSFSVKLAVHLSIGPMVPTSTVSRVKEEAPEMKTPSEYMRHLEDPLNIIKRETDVEIGTEYIKVEIENTTEEKCWRPIVAGFSQLADLEKTDTNDTKISTSFLKKRRLPTQKIAHSTSSKISRNKQSKAEFAETESVDNNTEIHTETELKNEVNRHTNKTDICPMKKSEKSKRKQTGENRFQCSVCIKKFNHKTSYEIHTRTHTGEKPYMCDVCTKCFIGRNALTIHIRTHTGEKPYKCNVCEKCFSTNTAMKKHIRIHTGDKPYMCNICKKCFIQKTSLDCHIRAHTGDKPYICKICNKSFKQKSQLDHHIRTHTGDKPFSCKMCKKRFTKKITLKEHLRVHTGEKPYICNVCQKGFVRKSALTIHIRKHTGDKPYMCHMCNKCFRSRSTLTDHIRTHTGDKPFSCDVCKKCFTKKATLTGHIRLHIEKKL